ncbi:uncharacterized protein isoform X3 [Macaca fascicularis]|uniref:uncharacterized protein isoform X3 n=1 Tax=Macaca fascicularis TaxID=9541 RepID=UPI0032B062B8
MTAQHPEICRFSEEEVKAKATDRRGGNQNLFHIPLPFPRKGQLVPGPRLSYWGPSSLLSLYGGRENDGSRVVRRKRESDGRLQKPPWRWVTHCSLLGRALRSFTPLNHASPCNMCWPHLPSNCRRHTTWTSLNGRYLLDNPAYCSEVSPPGAASQPGEPGRTEAGEVVSCEARPVPPFPPGTCSGRARPICHLGEATALSCGRWCFGSLHYHEELGKEVTHSK